MISVALQIDVRYDCLVSRCLRKRANLVMELAVDHVVLAVHQLERVRAVAVHVTVSVGDATVAKEEHHLMRRLGSKRDEVPEHISILQRFSFINVDSSNFF